MAAIATDDSGVKLSVIGARHLITLECGLLGHRNGRGCSATSTHIHHYSRSRHHKALRLPGLWGQEGQMVDLLGFM